MNAQRTPDAADIGWVECHGGAFDGTEHAWPIANSDIVLSKNFGNDRVSTLYRDTGNRKLRRDGASARIFREALGPDIRIPPLGSDLELPPTLPGEA